MMVESMPNGSTEVNENMDDVNSTRVKREWRIEKRVFKRTGVRCSGSLLSAAPGEAMPALRDEIVKLVGATDWLSKRPAGVVGGLASRVPKDLVRRCLAYVGAA